VRDVRGVWHEAEGAQKPVLQGGQGTAARAPRPQPNQQQRQKGGKGQRGDTDRIGHKILSSLYQQVLASGFSLGEAEQARLPALNTRSGLSCAHCGFEAGSAGAFYCPKCGMRMIRGA